MLKISPQISVLLISVLLRVFRKSLYPLLSDTLDKEFICKLRHFVRHRDSKLLSISLRASQGSQLIIKLIFKLSFLLIII